MRKHILIILVLSILGSSCFTQKKILLSPEGITTKMQATYPNYTVEQLKKGRILTQKNCGGCHELKNPTLYTKEALQTIVPNMCKEVNKDSEILSAQDQELILRYMVSMTTVQQN